ncbi:hypothetical protein [Massilia sp. METH4]|uniref:hypothetical protein n=1 Tax=Massilia sp. METH4 TaxID=3123041 RepID=UPI0030CCC406
MIDADQAKALILRRSEGSYGGTERFTVQSCALSERGDYWVIRVNSEDFVVRGMRERCYVGANAHLVDTATGRIETVGSGQSVEQYLEDKYDAAAAGDMHYVLGPDFGRDAKMAVIRLRQKLECSLAQAMMLVSPASSDWLTGKKSTLSHAQAMLLREGIATVIRLQADAASAVPIDDSIWHWRALKAALNGLATQPSSQQGVLPGQPPSRA